LALIIASKFTTYNSSVSALPDYYITGPVLTDPRSSSHNRIYRPKH